MEPSHTANHHPVIRVILPTRESACDRIATIVKGEDIRHSATVIFHIDHDGAVTGIAINNVVPCHDAGWAHVAIGQNAHLEGRVLQEGEIHASGVGNLLAVGIRLLAVGRVYEYSALG